MEYNTVWFKHSDQVPQIELRQNWRTANGYDLHSHEEYSVGLIDEGTSLYHLHPTQYAIKTNDLVTIDSNAVHSCNPTTADWSYRMVFIEPHYLSTLFGTKPHQLRFSKAFHNDSKLTLLFNDLFTSLVQEEPSLVIESQLIQLCEPLWIPKQEGTIIALASIKRIHELLQDQPQHDYNLQYLSTLAELSPYQLIRQFKKAYGLPPHAFQLDLRIKKAKPLLRQGMSLSQVALELGFADQAHFQRHFKKRLAVTPKSYQNYFIG